MIFTNDERRLIILYYSGSAAETIAIVREALDDITDPDERRAAGSLLSKLEGMSHAELDNLAADWGCCYA